MKLFYPGQIGGPFGWGTFGAGFTSALRSMNALAESREKATSALIPMADHNLTPSAQFIPGVPNIAMTFFESELGPRAVENAARYDHIFCGSTWCKERLAERGIAAEVLIQGVDHSIFKPGERKPDGQFRIFSGGKFEYRKGQDLVIAAFREFAKTHPDAHLVCSWFNPWPQLIGSMCQSPHIDMGGIMHTNNLPSRLQFEFYRFLFTINGIDSDRVTVLPQLSHEDLAREMQNTDCALFPNRCEGGTNLVLMEYAATGGMVVANPFTGHADISGFIDSLIIGGVNPATKWAEQSVCEIVVALDRAYAWRKEGRSVPAPTLFTWEAAARKVIEAAERILDRNAAG